MEFSPGDKERNIVIDESMFHQRTTIPNITILSNLNIEEFNNKYRKYFNFYVIDNYHNVNQIKIRNLNSSGSTEFSLSLKELTSKVSFGKEYINGKVFEKTYITLSNNLDFLYKIDSQYKIYYDDGIKDIREVLQEICNEDNFYIINNFKQIYDFIDFDRQITDK